MATKKSKSSKSGKNKSTKTAAEKVEKTAKTNSVEKAEKVEKTAKAEKAEKIEKVEKVEKEEKSEKIVSEKTEKKSFLSGFFAKKYEEKESILTIFKNRKFYGALIGEIIGTMLLTLIIFAVSPFNGGVFNLTTYMFPIIAITIAIYAFSGACLNPLVTVGMMATRRISVIRGITYIIAEVIGAWLAWLIFSGFHIAGGETAMDLATMSAIAENSFWKVAMVELLGGSIIAFFFNRALDYKRSVFTFAAIVAGGIAVAALVGYVASAAFLGLSNNFVFNPAAAFMLQIFPTSGESFGEILGGICQALSAYALIPMIGGVIGFYLSDFVKRLSE